jgi:hypothetical protein
MYHEICRDKFGNRGVEAESPARRGRHNGNYWFHRLYVEKVSYALYYITVDYEKMLKYLGENLDYYK